MADSYNFVPDILHLLVWYFVGSILRLKNIYFTSLISNKTKHIYLIVHDENKFKISNEKIYKLIRTLNIVPESVTELARNFSATNLNLTTYEITAKDVKAKLTPWVSIQEHGYVCWCGWWERMGGSDRGTGDIIRRTASPLIGTRVTLASDVTHFSQRVGAWESQR